jgi:hypothetical protein
VAKEIKRNVRANSPVTNLINKFQNFDAALAMLLRRKSKRHTILSSCNAHMLMKNRHTPIVG